MDVSELQTLVRLARKYNPGTIVDDNSVNLHEVKAKFRLNCVTDVAMRSKDCSMRANIKEKAPGACGNPGLCLATILV